MGYSAGTLDLSILGVSDSAVASIDRTVKSLNSLSRAINKINNSNFYSAGIHLEYIFLKIAKATNSINTNNLENLASASKSLSALTKVSKLESMNWDTVASGFNKLSIAITPFLEKVKEAEASLTALYGVLSKSSGKKIGSLLDGGNGSPKSSKNMFGGLFRLGSLTAVLYTAKRLGKEVANIVQSGSDYTETLNLWQVAMRNNLDMAEEFVNKMNKAYGISSKTVMNAQATFKNMIGSLGQIDDATAYKLSEALVQMSADFSSLYNVKLESAFQKMQAMLAGQVRPIRSAGLDMTETTLYQYYQALGGTKSMRQLNRTEKQLLSILAVYKQMGSAGALGDMTKTLNQFANQSRMMTEYWSELKVWSGLILKDFLDQGQVLIYINAALITATEIIKSIAKSKGLGEENFIDGLFETTEATNEEIDKLQGKLLEFDKFRSLDQGDNNVLGIDQKLLEALSGYSSKIDEAQNEAQKLAETWLKALGIDGGFKDLIEKINTLNWGKFLGEKLAKFINYIDFDKLAELLFRTIDNVLKNTWEFVVNLVINIDWKKLGESLMNIAEMIGNSWLGKFFDAMMGYWSTGNISVPQFASGGLPDKGTMFVAGEAGAEMVYNMPSGQSGVANVKQIEQAMYNALARHSAEGNEPIVVQAYLDGEKVYENTTSRAKSRGKVWANV
jgi:hypothetical protein